MAAVEINAIQASTDEYNLTDSADFTALVAGAGNGVTFQYNEYSLVFLKNDTGGPAVFTLKLKTISELAAVGVTPADPTVSVATGKIYFFKPSAALQNSDAKVTIECDVAGKALVVKPT